MKTAVILHGWAGGNWHTKRFVKGLKENGIEVKGNLADADIIIAHSTGCYRIKGSTKAKIVLFMGPPY